MLARTEEFCSGLRAEMARRLKNKAPYFREIGFPADG
jgi:hypothetical protein